MSLVSYIKQVWENRNVTTPDNYVVTKGGGGAISSGDTVTMTVSAGTVTAAGTPVNATNLNNIEDQVEAITTLLQQVEKELTLVTTTGSANAYVVTYSPAEDAYYSGMVVLVKASFTNTGSATANVNGLGAKTIKRAASTGLVTLYAGDITANMICILVYDGTDLVLLNPKPTTIVYVPSDNVLVGMTASTERSTSSASYVTLKSFIASKSGSVRIKGQGKNSASNGYCYIQAISTMTGVVLGETYTGDGASGDVYSAFTLNTTANGINAGDTIAIQVKYTVTGIAYIKDVTICADEGIVANSIVD